jgi:hypothetical protein
MVPTRISASTTQDARSTQRQRRDQRWPLGNSRGTVSGTSGKPIAMAYWSRAAAQV